MHTLIGWFARNPVAANLMMVFIVVWGLATLFTRLPLEVFPSFELDTVSIQVPFRGATPVEVEQGVTIKIEEAIQDINGIKELTSSATEGLGNVTVEIDSGYDTAKVQREIEQRIDQISDFPADTDVPSVYVPQVNREVLSVVVAGALSEKGLRSVAARVRDELDALPDVSSVQLTGAREYELAIEISEQTLRSYGLTLSQVADTVRSSSLDLAAGSIRTPGGEVLLRTKGQAYDRQGFSDVVVVSRNDGTRVTLGDIADIRDGFEEDALEQQFNGQRSIEIEVYRTGLQSAITVSDAVKDYLEKAQSSMPHGVTLGYWRDSSRAVKARLNTLLTSAVQGGFLIMLLLTLFLRFWVAVWVFVGVPVSILGGIALMPVFGVSINLLSLFAFILVLGIVVDDAIVTGENIYSHMRRDPDGLQAAIAGTREVAVPVTFGVMTTVAAFTPLLMIEGVRGEIFAQIPLIIIPVLLFSIIESKFILPAHMRHLNFHSERKPNPLARVQLRIADGFENFVANRYQPMLRRALDYRYAVVALFVGGAIVVFSIVSAGHVRFVFFPRVQSEVAVATLEMPDGTPFEVTQKHVETMTTAAQRLQKRYVDPETNRSVIESILSSAGSAGGENTGSHLGRVMLETVPPEERSLAISSSRLVREWKRDIGDIPGADSLSYRAEIGRGGSPIDVQITGQAFDVLKTIAGEVKSTLQRYPGVTEIADSFDGGKQEIQLEIKPQAQQYGVNLSSLANQVRDAFLGTEVQTIQRDRDDVDVIVRYPESERRSLDSLERLSIRTGDGAAIPLERVAEVSLGRGFAAIERVDRRRTIDVEAEVNKEAADIEGIKADLTALGKDLESRFPGYRLTLEGEAREQRESFGSLRTGLVLVLLVIYTLLAIPFKSYLQPLLVMVVIPFGVVGGVLGHMLMGMSLSIMSYMGMLALCGVVVNDSLVLVDYVNRRRAEGVPLIDAVRTAGVARFRAVILTSLTTFFGLVPLIFETSTQAQFLIPMAVSLGFGILFATLVTLVLVPVNYMVLEDIRRLGGKPFRVPWRRVSHG